MSRFLLGGYLIPEKKEVILSAVKARLRKNIHKYGIEFLTFGPGQGAGQIQWQNSVDGCSQVRDAQC
jgi:hypothetical protein